MDRESQHQISCEPPNHESKTFIYQSFHINYLNTSQVCYTSSRQTKDVKVDNFVCYQEGNILYKVTEVSYNYKVIRIEDKFQVTTIKENVNSLDHPESEAKMGKNADKVRIFYKDPTKKLEKNKKGEKRDKKNIVKNLVKIFLAWIQKKKIDKGPSLFEDVQTEMKKILNHENFNNRLIKVMIGNDIINKKFLHFLVDSADQEVKYSRINDKASHYEAIELYRKLLEDGFKEERQEEVVKNEGQAKSTQKEEKVEEKNEANGIIYQK